MNFKKEDLQSQRWDNLGRLLGFGWMAFHIRVVHHVKSNGFHDLTDAHFRLTRSMDYDGTRISDLARRAGVTKQAMSQLVRSMEEMGYLKRVNDAKDKRAQLIRYTRRGKRLAKTIVESANLVEDELREMIGAKNIATLKTSLTCYLDAFAPDHQRGWKGVD